MASKTNLPIPPLQALVAMAQKRKAAKGDRGKMLGAALMKNRLPPEEDAAEGEGGMMMRCPNCGKMVEMQPEMMGAGNAEE